MRLPVIPLAFLCCINLLGRGFADMTVGGIYDENSVQTNTVNTSATAFTAQQMTTAIADAFADAFAAGRGGVIDFDSGAFERDGSMRIQFGSRLMSLFQSVR